MLHELHRQGLSIKAIAQRSGLDRKTVRKYLRRGLEPPVYGPRQPRASILAPYYDYLNERLKAYPELSGQRLHRELRELGFSGGYSTLTDYLREIRPPVFSGFEHRFETPPGQQAQVDFAHFKTVFTAYSSEGGTPFQPKTAVYSSPRRQSIPVKAATDRSVATQKV